MTRELRVVPRGPYSLELTARLGSDATRTFRDGVLTAAIEGEIARAWQCRDSSVVLRAESDTALERLRFVLAADDDHSEFLRRFRDDPLLRETIRRLAGMRQLRTVTVAHSLLRALCGQLIEARRARAIERAIVHALMPEVGAGLHAAPTSARLAAVAPASLRAHGLHARRGATLVRLCGGLDLERLHAIPTALVEQRLLRERGLGPWSLGVVSLEGLGRVDRGLVADLGLVKLLSALRGRRVEAAETAELLVPYGEWAGLASVYLLAGFGRGLVPLPAGSRASRGAVRLAHAAA